MTLASSSNITPGCGASVPTVTTTRCSAGRQMVALGCMTVWQSVQRPLPCARRSVCNVPVPHSAPLCCVSQTHEGAGILKPLAGHMAGLVVERLRGLDASQALDIACVSSTPCNTTSAAQHACPACSHCQLQRTPSCAARQHGVIDRRKHSVVNITVTAFR